MKIRFHKGCGEITRIGASLLLVAAMSAAQVRTPAELQMPQAHDPLSPYMANSVPEPVLTNSKRLESLIRDGKLYLSLRDAIDLALENNLDLAIARYNLPIADTDVLRTKAGASFRGVNTGVVQGTPGGGVGGFGAGAPGAGAGGTTGGAGGAGAGASGLVQSTLGVGTPVSSYDPQLNVNGGIEHLTLPQSNLAIYGVPSLQLNTTAVNANFSQAFSSGTSVSFEFTNNRQTTNSTDVVGFLKGYRAGVEWLYQPANREIVEALLTANIRDMTPALARQSYDLMLAQPGGIYRDARPDLPGIGTVLALRSKYATLAKALSDPSKYVDLSYYDKAFPSR